MHIYIDIYMFNIHTHEHTLSWWYVFMLGGLSDHAIARLYDQMLWRLCLNTEVIRWWEVCVLGYFNAHMVLCSRACILPLISLYTLMFKCSHIQLLLFHKTYSLILIEHQPFVCILMCTYLDDNMSICLEVDVLMQLDVRAITSLDSRAITCTDACA